MIAVRHCTWFLRTDLLICAAAVMFGASSGAAATYRVVAKSGDATPGIAEKAIASLRSVQLDNQGKATVVAYIDTGQLGITPRGIWTETHASQLSLIAYEGGPASEVGEDATFSRLGDVYVNVNGSLAFTSQLDNALSESGLWFRDAAGLRLLAASYTQAPGLPAGSLFGPIKRFNDSPAMAMNSAGDIAVLIPVLDRGVGLWSGNATSGLTLRAIEGQAMPGFPEDDPLEMFAFGQIYGTILGIDSNGQLTFHGYTEGIGNPTATGPNGLWQTRPGGLDLVLREGSALPGDDESVVSGIFAAGPSSPSGVFPIIVHTANATDSRILLSDHGSLTEVMRVGEIAPGGDGLPVTDFFGAVEVNDARHVVVTGQYGVRTAIWSNFRGAGFEMIFQELDPAPGIDGAVFANSRGTQSVPFRGEILNENGQFAMHASLEIGTGGISAATDAGIWASDRSGALQLIVQEGQEISLSPGDKRIISQFTLSDFNDRGQLAFVAYFTDGTSAALVSNQVAVPESSSVVLMGTAWLLAAAIGRTKRHRKHGHSTSTVPLP